MPVIGSDADSSEKQVVDALTVDVAKGLTSDQVEVRQRRYGRNEVAEKQPNPVLAFAKKFWGLTAWMLEVAIVLSFVLGKYLDFYIIAALLLVNAILGFIQERQATRAVGALKQKLQLKARGLSLYRAYPQHGMSPYA
ncbi:MAG: cation-transporting P-type ATPase [Candidatus Bathyarchaeia archaeon]